MNKTLVALLTTLTFVSGCNSKRSEPEKVIVEQAKQLTDNSQSVDDILMHDDILTQDNDIKEKSAPDYESRIIRTNTKPRVIKEIRFTNPDRDSIGYNVTTTYYHQGEIVSSKVKTEYHYRSSDNYQLFHELALELPSKPVDKAVFQFISAGFQELIAPLEIDLTPEVLEQYRLIQSHWERWECQGCKKYQGTLK
jgi:hypothetical protein